MCESGSDCCNLTKTDFFICFICLRVFQLIVPRGAIYKYHFLQDPRDKHLRGVYTKKRKKTSSTLISCT